MMQRKKIALVTGGFSGEAQVSYKSADTIQQHLDDSLFEVYRIHITPQKWFHPDQHGKEWEVNKADFSLPLQDSVVHFDAVFLGLHGTPGEDGRLQGYFDLLSIPYTSCGTATSALTFNKRFTVAVAAFGGVRVAQSVHLFREENTAAEDVLKQLKLPVFVKPNNGGSSIGMSKVDVPEDLPNALEKAFREDDQVLVEEFITGREFTIGVYKSNGMIRVLPITEVKSKKAFFDFEAKYTAGLAEETTPAQMDPLWQKQVEETAVKVYRMMQCRGVVRMDFIYQEEEGTPFLLEINTIPGQSSASIVPQQVRAAGLTLKEFYTLLLMECFAPAT
jgi:D-alanine-D-alanine ligase